MGVRQNSVASSTTLGNVPATGAETALVTTPPLNLPLDFTQVLLWWRINQTIGVGTTSVNLRVRRGPGVSGAQFDSDFTVTVTAGNIVVLSGCTVDTPGAVAGQQYTITMAGTGTTGVFTTNDVVLIAMAL